MYEDDPDDDWFTPEEVAPDLIDEAMTYLVDAGRPRPIPQALRAKIVREYELCGDTEPDGQVVFWLEPEDLLRQMAPAAWVKPPRVIVPVGGDGRALPAAHCCAGRAGRTRGGTGRRAAGT